MEKLILPLNCVIEGDLTSIAHEGDVQIDNGILPASLFSGEGDITLTQVEPDSKCESISAKLGKIDLEGSSLNAQSILSKSFHAQLEKLEAQSLQVTQGKTVFVGEVFKVEQLNAEAIEIEADSVHISRLFAGGDVTIRAERIHVDELVGEKVTISGSLESNKVTASKGMVVDSGRVAIKNLDAPTFHSEEGVGGIVMVATCEEVQTKGVRGFLLPSELGLFSKGNTTMDLSEILGAEKDSFSQTTATVPEPQDEPEHSEDDSTTEPEAAMDDEDQAPTEPWPTTEEEEKAYEATPSEPVEDISDEDAVLDTNKPIENEEPEAQDHDTDPAVVPEEEDDTNSAEQEVPNDVLSAEEPDESSSPFFKTTTVVPENENADVDTGEMKTVQLEPMQLAHAIQGRSIAMDEPQDDEEALDAENMVTIPPGHDEEAADLDSQDLGPELASLPEIEDFDDYHNTGDLGDAASQDDAESPLQGLAMPEEEEDIWESESGEIEVEELSEEDFYSVEEGELADLTGDEDEPQTSAPQEDPETALRKSLTDVLNQIRACFPDENYPKFIYQIQNYVNEGRYSILAKSRNKEAVLSSFEKLNHPEISQLSGKFYSTLDDYFQENM